MVAPSAHRRVDPGLPHNLRLPNLHDGPAQGSSPFTSEIVRRGAVTGRCSTSVTAENQDEPWAAEGAGRQDPALRAALLRAPDSALAAHQLAMQISVCDILLLLDEQVARAATLPDQPSKARTPEAIGCEARALVTRTVRPWPDLEVRGLTAPCTKNPLAIDVTACITCAGPAAAALTTFVMSFGVGRYLEEAGGSEAARQNHDPLGRRLST